MEPTRYKSCYVELLIRSENELIKISRKPRESSQTLQGTNICVESMQQIWGSGVGVHCGYECWVVEWLFIKCYSIQNPLKSRFLLPECAATIFIFTIFIVNSHIRKHNDNNTEEHPTNIHCILALGICVFLLLLLSSRI